MRIFLKNGTYFGYFQNGEFDGKGIFKYSDGSIYQGTYKEGKKNGYGSLTNSDGSIYVGDFLEGLFDGEGIFKFSNGSDSFVTFLRPEQPPKEREAKNKVIKIYLKFFIIVQLSNLKGVIVILFIY